MFRIKPGQIWSNFGGVRLGWVVDPCKPNSKPSPIEVYYWVPGWWVFPKMTSSHGWNVGDVSSSIGFTTSKIEHPLSSKYLITISGWCFWTGMGPWVTSGFPGSPCRGLALEASENTETMEVLVSQGSSWDHAKYVGWASEDPGDHPFVTIKMINPINPHFHGYEGPR